MTLKEIRAFLEKNDSILIKVLYSYLFIFFGFFIYYNYIHYGYSSNYLNIHDIEAPLFKAIEKGIDLETFKSLINQERLQNHENSDIRKNPHKYLKMFWISKNQVYVERPLEDVLLKMKAQYIVNSENNYDKQFIDKINNLIKENNYTNPFEKLEPQQIYLLENIKIKADTLYEKIEKDVSLIVEEFDNKNKLVNEYLAKSRLSYRNSIIAMSISAASLLLVLLTNIFKLFSQRTNKNIEPTETDIGTETEEKLI